MRCARHVARVGGGGVAYRVLVTKREGRDHFENLGLNGSMLLQWTLNKGDGKAWTGLI